MKRQRNSYSVEEKLRVVDYAREYGRNKAASHFGLDAPLVGRWVAAAPKMNFANKKSKRVGSGRSHLFPEEEEKLYTWIRELREAAIAVTLTGIKIKMLSFVHETAAAAEAGGNDIKKRLCESFKAGSSWARAFLRRRNFSLRKTKVSQKLPAATEEKLRQFQRYVIRLRTFNNYPLGLIGNMDETPVWFDMEQGLTINPKGEKTVHIRTTGNERNRFTVVLTCLADGTKLPPVIIFKGKQWPRTQPPPPRGIIVWWQEKGWMDEEGMRKWTDYWSTYRTGGLTKTPAMLVFDSFSGHLTDSVKNDLRENNTDLVVIPGGLTSVCQPLDVSINRPFKVYLRNKWHTWMANGGAGITAGGNLRRATLHDACTWVLEAWNEISPAIVIKAFKKCMISNNLDGSEDMIPFENSDEEQGDEEEEDLERRDDDEEEEDEDNVGGDQDLEVVEEEEEEEDIECFPVRNEDQVFVRQLRSRCITRSRSLDNDC
jgi:hypothetical protein